MILYEVYMGIYPAIWANVAGFNLGYSVMSFMVLYLIGRYIYLYGVPKIISKYSFSLYILSSVILALLAYFALYEKIDKMQLLFSYANPVIIFSSICYFLAFERINIKPNKFINHIAKSVLAILIIHTSKECSSFLKPQYQYIYNNYGGLCLMGLWLLSIIIIFTFSLLIDQLRILSYNNILKLKKH